MAVSEVEIRPGAPLEPRVENPSEIPTGLEHQRSPEDHLSRIEHKPGEQPVMDGKQPVLTPTHAQAVDLTVPTDDKRVKRGIFAKIESALVWLKEFGLRMKLMKKKDI